MSRKKHRRKKTLRKRMYRRRTTRKGANSGSKPYATTVRPRPVTWPERRRRPRMPTITKDSEQ